MGWAMARIRALGVAFAVALLAGVLASAAPAVVRPVSDHTLTTTHFMVHYYTDVLPSGSPALDYSTETQAGDIGAYAEQAYSLFASWGYTAPPDDGDGRIDIYVTDLSGPPAEESLAFADNAGPGPSTGDFELATPTEIQTYADTEGLSLAQEEQKAVALNVFYMFTLATWTPTSQGDDWLLEGAGQWGAVNTIGLLSSGAVSIGSPDIALTCRDNLPSHQMCDPIPFNEGGWARWAFFQMLSNEFGTSFTKTAFANAAAGQTAATALANALSAKGTSLANVFNDYTKRLLNADFGVPGIVTARPPAFANVLGGGKAATLPTTTVPVDHLSARYLTFQRGDGTSHACFAATLSINVAIPAGTSAQPYFFWDVADSTPQALSVNGSNASITVPWDTCDWGATRGWLSLPNAGTTVDGATFTVTGSVTVDTNTPAAASAPPTPVSVWGTTVPVPTTDVAPSIDVFGPELLQLSAASPTIRLIVESSGPGTVNATLGSTALGSRTLRSGNNDLRFVVPKGVLTSLRRSASAANLLTLTPMSSTGSVAGQPVTRHVVIAAPSKAKKHKKK
jgi:hypothetical protein